MDYQFGWKSVDVWVDTDYAGCRRTRKSSTGGVIVLGNHAIKSWSNTQSIIALSSGEAEYYGLVRGGSMGLGMRSILNDMGLDKKLRVLTDSSAAKGIASRRGLGKVRHVEVNQLWIQDKVAKGEIELVKIPGNENVADALTKAIESEKITWHMSRVNLHLKSGRHELMPEVESHTQ